MPCRAWACGSGRPCGLPRFMSCGWWIMGKNPLTADLTLGRMDPRCRPSSVSQVIGPVPPQAGWEACLGALMGDREQLSLCEVSWRWMWWGLKTVLCSVSRSASCLLRFSWVSDELRGSCVREQLTVPLCAAVAAGASWPCQARYLVLRPKAGMM